ncbi:MAG: hypothetical protein LC720_08675 [Actinobacteria bacterium]|nr:hypothetical protein [Actinomycetota bacterium]
MIEWVASAAPGDRVPEPWRWARSPTQSVLLILFELGVTDRPAPDADPAMLVRDAAAAARTWLDEHPPAPVPAPAPAPDRGSAPAPE